MLHHYEIIIDNNQRQLLIRALALLPADENAQDVRSMLLSASSSDVNDFTS